MRVAARRSPVARRRPGSVAPDRSGRSSEGGYNLVILAVLITVMNIAVAVALPVWSHAMQREREEELIFRGLQYAEAIRVFQNRFGRLPVRLEELIETEPRSIRQLWKDPITDSRDWGLVLMGQGGAEISPDDSRPRRDKGAPGDPSGSVGTPGTGPNLPRGPIQGVYSRSTEESIKVFLDRQQYNQWKFTVALLSGFGQQRPSQGTGGQPNVGGVTQIRLDARWIGRPFRPGIQPGVVPGQNPGQGNRRPGGSLDGGVD